MNPWLPALMSSGLLAVLGFLLSVPYRKAVEAGIEAAFNRKLEILKGEIRADEARLSAQLRKRDNEIAALQTGALANLEAYQAELAKRRLLAIERVWDATLKLGKFKLAAKFAQGIEFTFGIEAASKRTNEGSQLRAFAEAIWKSSGLEGFTADPLPDGERLFVPPLAWATFVAFRSTVTYPVMQLALMKGGLDGKVLKDPTPIMDMLKAALPHQTAFIDEHKGVAFSFLIDEIEEGLFRSLRSALDAPAASVETVEQAQAIIVAAQKLDLAARNVMHTEAEAISRNADGERPA